MKTTHTRALAASPTSAAGPRRMRWLVAGSLLVAAFVWQASAHAGGRGDQIAGAIIGAGFGAVIGQHIGGNDGAIIGGAIGAATGAAAAGNHGRGGHRVYRTHGPAPRVVYRAPVAGYGYSTGHAPWVGTLAAPGPVYVAPPVIVHQPVVRIQRAPTVVYHPQRPFRHGHVRGPGHGHRGGHDRRYDRRYGH
ncbi:MAG: hypothetical protein R3E87_24295 [Burkholderiaceae bacterium]